MTTTSLGHHGFTLDDQRWFAEVSGDANPMHVDPVAARRSVAGAPVVHGAHLVLWALDRWASSAPGSVGRIRASFLHPVTTEEGVEVRVVVDDEGVRQLQVASPLEVKVVIGVEAAAAGDEWTGDLPVSVDGWPVDAAERRSDGAAGATGTTALALDPSVAVRFPCAGAALGPAGVAGLLAVSRVVGMSCPGLHSLLVGLDLAVGDARAPELRWEVVRARSPRSPITLAVDGALTGEVRAFFRPPPVEQLDYDEAAALVVPGEFAGRRALVVGGSRGLGEVCAKLLAAGGADVTLTWHQGRADGDRVADEIIGGGGRARARRCDVLAPEELADVDATDLCYFATPRIRATGTFDPADARLLLDHHVDGLWRTVQAVRGTGGSPLTVLYPSSVYVDEPGPFPDYAVAKAAGEALCRWMDAQVDGVMVVVERFPRLHSDQTVSVAGATGGAPAEVVLAALRRLRPGGPA